MYCQGFAEAVREKARAINAERKQIAARKPAALLEHNEQFSGQTTAITLAERYELIKDKAAAWLKEEAGIHLVSSGGRGGYWAGSSEAYAEGRAHGSAAQFGRNARRKMLA